MDELHEAAKDGNLNRVMDLVENRGFNVEEKDNSGWTPLHFVSCNGQIGIVKYLVEHAHANVEAKSNICFIPLHLAAINGYIKVVQYLVEHTHAGGVNCIDQYGNTPLHYASWNSRIELVQYLVEHAHADIWIKNNKGETACDLACKAEIRAYLKKMMEDGEGGLAMTKYAAFNPSKKHNRIDDDNDSCSDESQNDRSCQKQRL